jgi:TPR repeat protein
MMRDVGTALFGMALAALLFAGWNIISAAWAPETGPYGIEPRIKEIISNSRSAHDKAALGLMYEDGLKIKKNKEEALKWIRSAAALKDPIALAALARRHETGLGVERDNAEALRLYGEAAEKGSAYAHWRIGELYFSEKDANKKREAISHLKEASDGGEQRAAVRLYRAIRNGDGADKNPQKAFQLLIDYASRHSSGSDLIAFELGNIYADGDLGVARNSAEAVRWYEKAGNSGNFAARRQAGFIYLYGIGLSKDLDKAINLLTEAAFSGDVLAQYTLGLHMLTDEPGPRHNAGAYLYLSLAYNNSSLKDKEIIGALRHKAFASMTEDDFEWLMRMYSKMIGEKVDDD